MHGCCLDNIAFFVENKIFSALWFRGRQASCSLGNRITSQAVHLFKGMTLDVGANPGHVVLAKS